MHLTDQQRLDLLRERLQEICWWRERAFVELEDLTFDGEPLGLRSPWPERTGVRSFMSSGAEVPSEWRLAETRLDLDVGGEGLLVIEYRDGRQRRFGLDPQHRRFPVEGRTFDVRVEAVARLPFGRPHQDPRLAGARLVWTDIVLERFARRLRLILEAATALPGNEVVGPLISCAERALARVDWPSTTSDYLSRIAPSDRMMSIWEQPADLLPQPAGLTDEERSTVAAAGEELKRDLASLQAGHPQRGALALTGHAHLDLAWLWPIEETRRKTVRTWETVAGLVERYPELMFNQSSAQLYAFVEEDDPNLFERIKDEVAAGRWEHIGGMWVEPDANMPCGESFVRQLLYGQRYFKRAFGSTDRICWLPDCFGFSPGLPQLLLGAGIDGFFTHKLTWSETNRFPHDLFWWEGLDGSRVLAHGFDNPVGGYNGELGPEAMMRTWENFRGKHLHPESLLSIGYGDGGGGPTDEMIESARELDAFPVLPRLRFARVEDFYDDVRDHPQGPELPLWVGELYLELHRGTLTTQSGVKYQHRRAERDLIAAEALSALNLIAGGEEPESLEPDWQILLRNQFHDILCGSGIREVNETARTELTGVRVRAMRLIEGRLDELAGRVVPPGGREGLLVVNPDLSPRPLRLELAEDLEGAQAVESGSVLSGVRFVEGLEATAIFGASPAPGLHVSANHLENEYVRVQLDPHGTLASVYDKVLGREVLDGRGNQLWVYVDKPRDWDAWDIDAGYAATGEEVLSSDSIGVVESGPHRAAVRVQRRFRNSRIVQDLRLWSNSRRIEFKTTLEWGDRRWLLKARFPLAIHANIARFETAFGVVERPTHRNTSWDAAQFEVAAHRFVDLSEPGYGAALINDGKYGHHAVGNELGISLLRSPTYPDPRADEGAQIFTYALYPHAGDWLDGGVLAEAEDLNRPLLNRRVRMAEETSWRPFRFDGLPLGLGALKVLEDGGGLVLRTYEPRGARGSAEVELPRGWTLDADLDLLEEANGDASRSFGPFQVRSWLLRARSGSIR